VQLLDIWHFTPLSIKNSNVQWCNSASIRVLIKAVCKGIGAIAIAIVRFNFCPHSTHLCRRVFDILPFAWDKTTSGFGNKIEAILEFYFRFRFIVIGMSFCICLPNFVVIGQWKSYIDFSWFFKFTSGLKFSGAICLRRWKSICMPNFDEISQSTAEIKLLPVSENWQPPYWQSIFDFDFDVCRHVILHLVAKFRSNQTIVGGVMMSYPFFQDGRRQPYWIWSG